MADGMVWGNAAVGDAGRSRGGMGTKHKGRGGGPTGTKFSCAGACAGMVGNGNSYV